MFYDNFLSLCAERKESPSGVAKKIGLSNAAANGWKKGKAPSDVNLAKLSNYFGVTIDYLLTGEQTEKPASIYGDGKIENMKLLLEKMNESGINLENATPDDLQRWVNIIVAAEK